MAHLTQQQLTQLAARIRAKQEELIATVSAIPDDVRAEHSAEVNEILSIYPPKESLL